MKLWILFVLILIIPFFSIHNNNNGTVSSGYKTDKPYLVVLSMDGCRWDYPEMYRTPNLDSIATVGVRAESLVPCFPSKTFPNHYSIATGLYPENHGIVQNSFTDPDLGDYSLSAREAVTNPDFYLGEPIWVTAEKQAVCSACFYWPGSEAPIRGIYANTWKRYDQSASFESRIDSVISWLKKPIAVRPHLIMWYFDEPDHVGHEFGPASTKTQAMVERLDSLVGVFCRKVNTLGIADSVNLVFTADHGMGAISPDRAINLGQYVSDNLIMNVKGGNPVIMLQPKPGELNTILGALTDVPHMKVYTKQTMPEAFHHTNSDRIFDIVCVADSAWSIYRDAGSYSTGGTHGYDPANPDMHAVFYASGPAFKKGYIQPAFQNIHLYSLFAEILGLIPAKTDGSLTEVEGMLDRN
jgi:alkaline phosphatase D